MNKKPHILFLYSDTGGGHRSAALAIIEALEAYFPDQVTTEMIDFFEAYAPPPFDKAAEAYSVMAEVPNLWELGYRLSNGKYRSKLVYDVLWPYIRKAAANLVHEHPCDMFVSVHPIINTPLLRIMGEEHKPYVIVITDLVSTHAFWYNRDATLTLSPTQEAKQRGVSLGVPEDKIEVFGQPISDHFRQPILPKDVLRSQLGWPQDLPVILMVGGGEGMGPLEETVLAVDKASLPLMMAVVTGRNQKLKTRLENAGLKTPNQIFGFVENMPQLMFAADAIVTKAGPGTISEAFIAGLPIILYSRMPGQEEGNVLFVVEKEVGVWAPEPQQVVETLHDWINHPEIIKNMAEKSRSYARPDASRDIAERIIQIVQQQ